MTLIPVKLNDNASIEIEFSFTKNANRNIFIVKALGDYNIGSLGNINGMYLTAMTAAACSIYKFNEIVFDFSLMTYEMSNSLMHCFNQVYKQKSKKFPINIISSCENRSHLESLIKNGNSSIKIINSITDFTK